MSRFEDKALRWLGTLVLLLLLSAGAKGISNFARDSNFGDNSVGATISDRGTSAPQPLGLERNVINRVTDQKTGLPPQ